VFRRYRAPALVPGNYKLFARDPERMARFQREAELQPRIACAIHFAHAACADGRKNLVH